MCYSIFLSTNSSSDLSKHNNELIKFRKIDNTSEDAAINLLSFSNIWYVGSKSNCSCDFRHIMTDELGFSEPVDWYQEEIEEIEATKQLYKIIKELLNSKYYVECLDKWEGVDNKDIKTLEVCFSDVSETEFRFIENYLFKIRIK